MCSDDSAVHGLVGVRRVRPWLPARRASVDTLAVQVRVGWDSPLLTGLWLDLDDALDIVQRDADLGSADGLDDEHAFSLVVAAGTSLGPM
jgi:hypothetical protein